MTLTPRSFHAPEYEGDHCHSMPLGFIVALVSDVLMNK